jgi:hypothetical protein
MAALHFGKCDCTADELSPVNIFVRTRGGLAIMFRLLIVLGLAVALSVSAQTCVANYTLTVLEDEPIAMYSFVSGPGATSIIDITGNGHNSKSIMGNAEIVCCGPVDDAMLFTLDGGVGGSIVLDLQMNLQDPEGDGIGVGLGDFSIEALVNSTAGAAINQVFISQKDPGPGRSNVLVSQNGFFGSFMGGATSNSDTMPVEEQWYHLVMTYDGDGGSDALRFYVDAEISGDPLGLVTPDGLPEPATGDWVLGSHKNEGAQFFDGFLDEVAFYDYRIDDPNGDDATDDSVIGRHYSALFPTGEPCDFDANGVCDIVDLDELQYTGLGGNDPKYDLDESGVVDENDTLAWLGMVDSVPGDADLDGDVDATDLNSLGISWLTTDAMSWAQGDFNGDRIVNAGDLNTLGINWQAGVAAASEAVPEPTSLGLWSFAVFLCWLWRGHR